MQQLHDDDAPPGRAPTCLERAASRYPRTAAALGDWFSSGQIDTRSESQLERERFNLWHPASGRYSRLYIIAPCILAQCTIGSIYSWSIFNKKMDEGVWGAPGANAIAFMCCVACYGLGTLIFGNWVERNGPFAAVARTVVLTPLGWLLAAAASEYAQLWLLYAGFGSLAGFGTSFTYLSTCSAMQKWFPELKGFAAGLAVMGFGVGSFVWTTLGKALMDPAGSYHFRPPQVQLLFSVIFAAVLLSSWPWMRLPPPGWAPAGYTPPAAGVMGNAPKLPAVSVDAHPVCPSASPLPSLPEPASPQPASPDPETSLPAAAASDASPPLRASSTALRWLAAAFTSSRAAGPLADKAYTFREAVSQLEFGILAVLVFGSSITGVVFLSSASDMVQNTFGADAGYAGTITSILNLMNFTGRFGWGWVSDRIGRKTFYAVAAGAQAVCLASLPTLIATQNLGGWLVAFLTIGSLYGGTFGVLPALCSDLFGSKISGATHGVMISVWASSAVIGIPIFTAVTSANSVTVVSSSGAAVRHAAPVAYIINAEWLVVLPVIACLAALLLNVNPRDRALRKAWRQLRIRLWAYVLVIELSGPARQAEEWARFVSENSSDGGRELVPAVVPDVHQRPDSELGLPQSPLENAGMTPQALSR